MTCVPFRRQPNVRLRVLHCVPFFAAALILGCGGDRWTAERPQPVPVTGTVLHNDQPVEGATVVFVPDGHKYAAAGQTDADGKFHLRTFEADDGAVPGNYKVTIRKVEVIAPSGPAGDDDSLPPSEERWLLPGRYSNAQSSGMTATIADDSAEDLVFKLTGVASKPNAGNAARSGGGE